MRQEAAAAHARFLDSTSKQLEATFQQEKEAACRKIEQEQAQLRAVLEEEHSKRTAELQREFDQKLAEAEAQHQAAKAEWESMLARRNSDSNLFTFNLRGFEGCQLSGAFPRQIFQAEPSSVLAHVYDGEWEYAADEKGRAVVNSKPSNWLIIMDWLSFGTVPERPSAELISECRYWQLDRLLAAIKMQSNPPAEASRVYAKDAEYQLEVSRSIEDDNLSITASGHIHRFQ